MKERGRVGTFDCLIVVGLCWSQQFVVFKLDIEMANDCCLKAREIFGWLLLKVIVGL